MAGKLKGAIIPKTPMGRRITSPSISKEAPISLSPCCITGMPQATSTFSKTRFISALASGRDLPISSTRIRLIFSSFSSSRSRSLKR